MKVNIHYWYDKEISHYRSKKGDHHCGHAYPGIGIPVPPSNPESLPDEGETDLTAEQIVALSKDFDIQILDRGEDGVILNLDRKYGKHHQRG